MRLIDADFVMDSLNIFNDVDNGDEHFLNGISTAKEIVDFAPTIADRHGHWTYIDKNRVRYWACSECGKRCRGSLLIEPYKFCPHCGAKMQ